MTKHWARTNLFDAFQLQRGFDLPATQREPGDHPVVASTSVVGMHSAARVSGPGVVVGRSGSIGGAQWVESDFWPLNTTLWLKDAKGNDKKFIYYLLKTVDFSAFNVGSGVPTLNRNHLKSHACLMPPLDEQQRIAGVLSSFDELIEENQKSKVRLFETIAAMYEMAASSSLHHVPFGEVAELVRDSAHPSTLDPATIYLGLEHFGADGRGIIGRGTAGGLDSSKSRFVAGDVLYGKLRPYFRKVAWAGFDGVCSSEVWVLRPRASFSRGFIYSIAASQSFTDFAMSGSGGTHMPRANWSHVAAMPVRVPSAEVMAKLDGEVDSIFAAASDLDIEAIDLRRQRDELLPLLMSGRIKVEEAG